MTRRLDSATAVAPSDDASSVASARNLWLARFVSDHGDSAYRTAYRLLRDRDDARDAVQDSLSRALRAWPSVPSEEVARAWLFRVLVNTCISRLRRRAVRLRALQLLGRAPAPPAIDPSIMLEVSGSVLPGLRALPIKQQTALILRFGDGRGVDEIATAMNVSPETVKTHLKRGLAELRRKLGAERREAVP